MKAPIPPDESARLRALHVLEILDTPPEPEFDDIATLAAGICKAPIALITLVDGRRQWFKAKIGLEATQTPREQSFCAHAIIDPTQPLVVPDATKDRRFADNPLVVGDHGIRFYAGAPLLTPEGQALGTLCVLDRKPRRLKREQLHALQVLSRHVMTQLQLRRQLRERSRVERELDASERRWQFALEGSDQGVWDWDTKTNELYYSPRWCAQLGYRPEEISPRLEEWSSRVHPDDLPPTLKLLEDHFAGRTPIYVSEHRMRAKDGSWRWMLDRGRVITRDAEGKPRRVVGIHIDITDRKKLEEERQRFMRDLTERVKELGVLQRTAELLRETGLGVPEMLQRVAELLPRAMLHPEVAAARVSYDGTAYATAGFTPVETCLTADFNVRGGGAGRLEIVYLRSTPAESEGPFLHEERQMLDSLAEMLRSHFERRAAEEALRLSQHRQRLILDSVDEGIHGIDLEGRITFENAAGVKLLGWSESELIGQHSHTLVHHHHAGGRPHAVEDCPICLTLRDGEIRSVATEVFFRRDGSAIPVEYVVSPVRDDRGKISGAVVCFRDITARKAAEARLKREEGLLQMAGKIAKVGGWAVTLPDNRLYWSKYIWDLVDYPKDQYPSLDEVLPYYLPKSRAQLSQAIGRCGELGESFDLETQLITPTGRQMWARVAGEAARDAQGKIVAVHGAFSDITAQKQADLEIRQSEERFRELADNIGDIFYNYDPVNNRLLYANAAYEKIFDRPLAAAYADPLDYFEAVLPEDRPVTEDAFRRQCSGEPTDVEFRIVRPDGTIRWIHEHATPIVDGQGRVERLVGTMRDITLSKTAHDALQESELRFRLLAGATNDAIWDLVLSADRLWWSEGHAKLFGHRAGETQASTADWRDNLHPEDRDRELLGDHHAIHGSVANDTHEYRYRRADGTYAYVLDRAQIIRDGSGRAVRLIGGMTDLTVIKEAEEEARRQSEALASIVDTLQEISYLKKPLTEVMAYMADRAQQLTGADGAVVEMIEGDHQVYLAGTGTAADRLGERIPLTGSLSGLAVSSKQGMICDDSETDDRVDRAACRRVGLRSMIVAPLRDGETIVGTLKVISAEPGRFGERDLNNLQILVESLGTVIQRQQATERLQASEERYRMLFDNNPHPMWVFDCETFRFLAVNSAALQHYGYSEAEFMAMTVLDIRAKQDQVDLAVARVKLPASGKELGYRFHRKKDGTVIEMEVLSDALRFKDRPARLVLAQDVTERRRSERKVREQAELLDKAQDAILVRDLGHHITYWNKSAERLYGWPTAEVLGRSVRELLYFDPKDFDQATAEVLAKGEWAGELIQQRRDGQSITIEGRWTLLHDAEGNPESVLAINTDITERKKLEQQFLRAQRMESIGTLAGGIAHDLNNLLAPITMGVELLRLNETNPRNQPVLDNIERSAKRGADLVKQVLSFARGVEGARVAVHLKHIIHDIEAIVKNTFPKNIRLETDVPKDLWLVLGDPTQLNQVLLNLTVNARDAMPNGGLLSIRTRNVELDQQYAVMNRGVPAGCYVVLEVSDTGSGIPPEIMDRIFDPFFTTKELGKGTGLGLSTLQGIVRSHGGFVNVYSEVGQGSTFKIHLPVHETGTAETAPETEGEKLPRGQGELILVVDDETTILSVTAQTLEAFGYRAITAEDGAQAIGLFAQRRTEIALVLTDMMMPVMDGPALVAALRRVNPWVPIIAASGLNANGNVARASAAGVTHFLAKPYSADALLRLLANVLRATGSRAPFGPPSP